MLALIADKLHEIPYDIILECVQIANRTAQTETWGHGQTASFRHQFMYVPSQWEKLLHCKDVSHWLGTYLDWSLKVLFLTIMTQAACTPPVKVTESYVSLCWVVYMTAVNEVDLTHHIDPTSIDWITHTLSLHIKGALLQLQHFQIHIRIVDMLIWQAGTKCLW